MHVYEEEKRDWAKERSKDSNKSAVVAQEGQCASCCWLCTQYGNNQPVREGGMPDCYNYRHKSSFSITAVLTPFSLPPQKKMNTLSVSPCHMLRLSSSVPFPSSLTLGQYPSLLMQQQMALFITR